jgi:hypothetical protein
MPYRWLDLLFYVLAFVLLVPLAMRFVEAIVEATRTVVE